MGNPTYTNWLAESGCDIIAVSEHWLWPFEADRLCNIHPAFTAEIKIDGRLTEHATQKRLWGSGVDVEKGTAISKVNSAHSSSHVHALILVTCSQLNRHQS